MPFDYSPLGVNSPGVGSLLHGEHVGALRGYNTLPSPALILTLALGNDTRLGLITKRVLIVTLNRGRLINSH